MSDKKWLYEYIDSINKNPNLTLKDLIDIVHFHFPKNLYRYRALSNDIIEYNGKNITKAEREIINFENNSIYLASPEELNDPYDSKPLFVKEKMMQKFCCNKKNIIKLKKIIKKKLKINEKYSNEDYKKIFKNILNEQLEKKLIFTNEYRIACFSEYNNNILMWSHYANYHRGYCIEYDISDFKENEYSKHLFPIIYSEKILDLSNTLMNGLLNKKNRSNKDINYWFYCTLYKAIFWEYEKEWRFVYHNIADKLNNQRLILFPKPTKIFLGAKIEDSNRDKLMQIAKQNNIDCYDMKMDLSKYLLYSEKILK